MRMITAGGDDMTVLAMAHMMIDANDDGRGDASLHTGALPAREDISDMLCRWCWVSVGCVVRMSVGCVVRMSVGCVVRMV